MNTSQPSARPLHVLLVDDDPFIRDALSELLVLLGASVIAAESRMKALAILAGREMEVILMDYSIPGDMPPDQFVAAVRGRIRPARIILITGDDAAARARQLGIRYFLEKPIGMESLREHLRLA